MFKLLLVITILVTISSLVQQHVPEPYMDEIFHLPQAQQYGRGDFYSWDPKLTTPPGLYLASLVLARCLPFLPLMTIQGLRATNLVFSLLLLFTLNKLIRVLHPGHSSTSYALVLWLFPLSFFYYFLYYTDTGSTFFVALSYLYVKTHRYQLAGLVGGIAVLFRQTNIIWVAYFLVLSAIQLIRAKSPNAFQDPACSRITLSAACSTLLEFSIAFVRHLIWLIPHLLGFLTTIAAFAVFLLWNGSIVLGDKTNHVAGTHLPQLLYYTSFVSFFSAPLTLPFTMLDHLMHLSVHTIIIMMFSMACMVYMVRYHTYEHPFLLSDNRHYSFYVWKKIYRRHWSVRYLLIPAYTISGWWNTMCLFDHVSFLWALGYLATLILTLVPSPLLEFRYFILPFLFYCLHLPPPSIQRTSLTIGFYTTLNLITLYLFIYRPFHWPNLPDQWQRFMW
ncbi:hypothetical protein DM01DRAFT_1324915 [Hesseltinella vesiculosa]|uniref:Dol-P-Glc:Glc(2)Man(9)GlcNAc(2)-PP-Dol alpha-1,2-glucosyltransferase n=1 Tax=Hesseltinella vesiculosa TaxID=101127 RepID=A0A1X2GCB0_9FUNG|nr:hypothetical protein DM01DRAFT_1324915 [Hesseltinella vesiculosa]